MALTVSKKVAVVSEYVDTTTTPLQTRHITHSGVELTGAVAAVAAAQTTTVGTGANTLPGVVEVTVANASTNIDILAPYDCKVVDAHARKIGVSADAGDLVTVKNGGTTLASGALNVADAVKVNLTLDIDHADNAFAEGDTITVDPTSSTDCACVLFIYLKRTA